MLFNHIFTYTANVGCFESYIDVIVEMYVALVIRNYPVSPNFSVHCTCASYIKQLV